MPAQHRSQQQQQQQLASIADPIFESVDSNVDSFAGEEQLPAYSAVVAAAVGGSSSGSSEAQLPSASSSTTTPAELLVSKFKNSHASNLSFTETDLRVALDALGNNAEAKTVSQPGPVLELLASLPKFTLAMASTDLIRRFIDAVIIKLTFSKQIRGSLADPLPHTLTAGRSEPDEGDDDDEKKAAAADPPRAPLGILQAWVDNGFGSAFVELVAAELNNDTVETSNPRETLCKQLGRLAVLAFHDKSGTLLPTDSLAALITLDKLMQQTISQLSTKPRTDPLYTSLQRVLQHTVHVLLSTLLVDGISVANNLWKGPFTDNWTSKDADELGQSLDFPVSEALGWTDTLDPNVIDALDLFTANIPPPRVLVNIPQLKRRNKELERRVARLEEAVLVLSRELRRTVRGVWGDEDGGPEGEERMEALAGLESVFEDNARGAGRLGGVGPKKEGSGRRGQGGWSGIDELLDLAGSS